MPISFDFKPQFNVVICRQIGTVDDNEFIASYRSLFDDSRLGTSMNLLVDLRQTDSSTRSREAIQVFADFLTGRIQNPSQRPKVAVIAPRDESYGLARMYEAYAYKIPWDFSVFREAAAAYEWLGITEDEIKNAG